MTPRILFFMHTGSTIGGVETWLDRACAHFAAHGLRPLVGLVRGMRHNRPERYRADHPDLPTVEVDGRGLNREGRVRALMRCIRDAQADIVAPLGIVDAYEAVVRCKQRGADVRLLARTQGNLAPMLADLAAYRDWVDLAVCPGRLTRRMLVEWAGYPEARVAAILNGADEPFASHRARGAGEPLRVGYVGRLSGPDKRATDLVALHRALEARNVPYRLQIVGDGPCRPELEAAFAGAPNVRMLGAWPHRDVYERIFPELDVLVLTSASESFGIVLVEAMMHGVVPVASRYDGFHAEELVVDGRTGLSFAVGDMEQAARQVERLARDERMRAALADGAKQRTARCTWQASLEEWTRAIVELARQAPLDAGTRRAVIASPASGRLERLGLPAGVVDALRRARRLVFGPAVDPGGEEWPLYNRTHSPARLAEVADAIRRLDVARSEAPLATPDAARSAAAT